MSFFVDCINLCGKYIRNSNSMVEFVNKLIDVLNELKEHKNIHRMEIVRLFGSIIKLNNISQYVANPNFIKY